MNVRELIARLQDMPQEATVCIEAEGCVGEFYAVRVGQGYDHDLKLIPDAVILAADDGDELYKSAQRNAQTNL